MERDTDPFQCQEPWVYRTASRDRPVPRPGRRHFRVLERAARSLESHLARPDRRHEIESELSGLRIDHFQAEQAIREATDLVRTDRPPWEIHLWRAQLFRFLGEPDRCADSIGQAIRSEPACPSLTHRFARLERELGHLERAHDHATRHLEHRPDSPHAHAELGHLRKAAGKHSEAMHHFSRAVELADGDERILREVDRAAPSLLSCASVLDAGSMTGKCAILVPGHLRRLESSVDFLGSLAGRCDLFLCTNEGYREAAKQLGREFGARWTVVEDDPGDARIEDALPVGSMKQWFKLARCLEMMLREEKEKGFRYAYIYKLRTDYHFVHARRFPDLHRDDEIDGLFAASDKVFGGRREFVMPLAGLCTAMKTHFLDRQHRYWPIGVHQILESGDSYKWFGMRFPARVVGPCHSVEALRASLHGKEDALESYRPRPLDRYVSLFEGHPRMASEICFARYLNLLGIRVHESERLAGFLLSDRLEEPKGAE
jgi:tetratricopeptide (TPR) repeat protein